MTENSISAQASDEPMRAAFEAWFSQDGAWPNAITRNGSGYRLSTAQSSWIAWQASWKAATPQPSGNTGELAPRATAEVEIDRIAQQAAVCAVALFADGLDYLVHGPSV